MKRTQQKSFPELIENLLDVVSFQLWQHRFHQCLQELKQLQQGQNLIFNTNDEIIDTTFASDDVSSDHNQTRNYSEPTSKLLGSWKHGEDGPAMIGSAVKRLKKDQRLQVCQLFDSLEPNMSMVEMTVKTSSNGMLCYNDVNIEFSEWKGGTKLQVKKNVMHHFCDPQFQLIRHDVVEPLLLEVDQIYHLACLAFPVHYKHNPVTTIVTCVLGILNMFGLVKIVGARCLLTSTSEVYGGPLQHPQLETYLGNVKSCYGKGKRTTETLAMYYHRGAGDEVKIIRIFNTYGPWMCIDDGCILSGFIALALRKEPLIVYGDGKQSKSFQYISTLVKGMMCLVEGENVGPFNLGNLNEFTMLELA